MEMIIHHDKFLSFQGCIHKWINTTHYVSHKNRNHMIVSIAEVRAFDNAQHPFMIKSPMKTGIEGTYLSSIKTLYNTPMPTLY